MWIVLRSLAVCALVGGAAFAFKAVHPPRSSPAVPAHAATAAPDTSLPPATGGNEDELPVPPAVRKIVSTEKFHVGALEAAFDQMPSKLEAEARSHRRGHHRHWRHHRSRRGHHS